MTLDNILLIICAAAIAFALISAAFGFTSIRKNKYYTACKGRIVDVAPKENRHQRTVKVGVSYQIYDNVEYGKLDMKPRCANIAKRLPILVDEATGYIKEDPGFAACAAMSGVISAELSIAALFVYSILSAL